MNTSTEQKPVIIKKYANRRLYDTGTSSYITLEDLCTRVKSGEDFLRSVIGMYDGKMQDVLQHYLEGSMKTFVSNQERLQGMLGKAVEGMTPFPQFNSQFNPLEELTRQNVAMFEKAVQMFNPFGNMFGGKEEEKVAEKEPAKRAKR